MRWINKVGNKVKRGIRSWLNVQETSATQILINRNIDFEMNAIRNRIWYTGDSDELQQLYGQLQNGVDQYKFWACRSTPGMEIRKIHTGLPALIVDILTSIVLKDIDLKIEKNDVYKELWEKIEEDNNFNTVLEETVKETLYIGDGAWKLTFDTSLSPYPIIEYFPGEQIEYEYRRKRLQEIIFKTKYIHNGTEYVLRERYGYGYIKNELYKGTEKVDIAACPETAGCADYVFGGAKADIIDGAVKNHGEYMMAVPIKYMSSCKWHGRGQGIFDKKIDAFDAFDESWSQWMDALRAGRSKEYIPECLIPRNPETLELMKPNHFDNRYIKIENDMAEKGSNKIDVEQPTIPHDSYLATYCTALDQCLQGIISPSTLGIDVKKLDNADAQREKEKATLYSRDTIIHIFQDVIPKLVKIAIRSYEELHQIEMHEVDITAEFGEYANPSFESQVETIGKAKTQGIMSVETIVDELYGDTKTPDWKAEEVARIKSEQGIVSMEEPEINTNLGGFSALEG